MNSKGQVHSTEAILAVVFLSAFIIFVIPSFAVPSYDSKTNQAAFERELHAEATQLIEYHRDQGSIKETMLKYEDVNGQFSSVEGITDPDGEYFIELPDGRLKDDIEEFEERHEVRVEITMRPATNASKSNPHDVNTTTLATRVSQGVAYTTTQTQITLFTNDWVAPSKE